MAWLKIVIQLLPLVIAIMKIIEELLGAGTGAIKKAFVLDSVKDIYKGSNDNTDEVWGKIQAVLGPMVDIACIFLFPVKSAVDVVEEDQEMTG